MRVGVLALQGAFIEHLKSLGALEVDAIEVRTTEELATVDALIIPGGESTTIGKLLRRFGFIEPLVNRAREGMPVWGTCAGMILLANEITDGNSDQVALGLLDATVQRNAFGRQVDSFVAPLDVPAAVGEKPFPAFFIRAPLALKWGPEVEVLAKHEGQAVALRQGSILATSFHPELTEDNRFHRYFVEQFVRTGECLNGITTEPTKRHREPS